MNSHFRRPPVTSLLCLLAFAQVLAEEPVSAPQPAAKPKPVEFDETAKKVFEAWEQKAYNLGRAGVKKATVNIKAKLSHPKLPAPLGCTGTFTWDEAAEGENGKLAYSDAAAGEKAAGEMAVGAMLMAQGWNAKSLSAQYDPENLRKALAGTVLKAETIGERTFLKVQGKAADGTSELVFDKDGVLDEMGLSIPTAQGTALEVRFKILTKKEGETYLPPAGRMCWTCPAKARWPQPSPSRRPRPARITCGAKWKSGC